MEAIWQPSAAWAEKGTGKGGWLIIEQSKVPPMPILPYFLPASSTRIQKFLKQSFFSLPKPLPIPKIRDKGLVHYMKINVYIYQCLICARHVTRHFQVCSCISSLKNPVELGIGYEGVRLRGVRAVDKAAERTPGSSPDSSV